MTEFLLFQLLSDKSTEILISVFCRSDPDLLLSKTLYDLCYIFSIDQNAGTSDRSPSQIEMDYKMYMFLIRTCINMPGYSGIDPADLPLVDFVFIIVHNKSGVSFYDIM